MRCLGLVLLLPSFLVLACPALSGSPERPLQAADPSCRRDCQSQYHQCVSRAAAGSAGVDDADMTDMDMDHCEDERLSCIAACPVAPPEGAAGNPGAVSP